MKRTRNIEEHPLKHLLERDNSTEIQLREFYERPQRIVI